MRVRRAKSRLRASRSAAGSVAATIANGVRGRRSDGRSTSTMNRSVGWKVRWRSSTASANAGFAQGAVRPSIGGPSERGGPARQDLLEAASPIRRCRSPPLQYAARKACRGLRTPTAAQCLMTCLRSLPLRLHECPLRVEGWHWVSAWMLTFVILPMRGRSDDRAPSVRDAGWEALRVDLSALNEGGPSIAWRSMILGGL